MKGFNWTSNTRVLVCIIAALLLTIWFTLWLQYYWMACGWGRSTSSNWTDQRQGSEPAPGIALIIIAAAVVALLVLLSIVTLFVLIDWGNW